MDKSLTLSCTTPSTSSASGLNPTSAPTSSTSAVPVSPVSQSPIPPLLQDPNLLRQLLPALQATLQLNNSSVDISKINEGKMEILCWVVYSIVYWAWGLFGKSRAKCLFCKLESVVYLFLWIYGFDAFAEVGGGCTCREEAFPPAYYSLCKWFKMAWEKLACVCVRGSFLLVCPANGPGTPKGSVK